MDAEVSAQTSTADSPAPRPRARISRVGLLISAVLLIALIIFAVKNVGDAGRFVALLDHAKPGWVLVGLCCQVMTYVCSGAIWGVVASSAGYRLKLSELARLAVEKLSMDHIMPTVGIAGNLVIIGAMRRLGVTASVATEALLIDILAYWGSYGASATVAMLVLHASGQIPQSITTVVAMFLIALAGVPLTIVWLVAHRDWVPGPRLGRFRWVREVRDAVAGVSAQRLRNPSLLLAAGTLHVLIFVIDGFTLWALLQAMGVTASVLTCFAATIIAAISATISFLPGGVGSFEAASVGTLAMLGVPLEAALAGTMLFRGLTLWLPLIPGFFLTRRDLSWWVSQSEE